MFKKFLLMSLLFLFSLNIMTTSFAANNNSDINLRRAILNNNLEEAQVAINNGADINHIEKDRTDNPLGVAVSFEYTDMVAFLLKNGANPNIFIDGNGFFYSTPLITAISRQNFDIIKLLVENGANVNLQSHQYSDPQLLGTSPLMNAVLAPYTKDSLNIFNYLIEKGANVNATTSDGDTALIFAANCNSSAYRQHAMLLMAEELIKKGANTQTVNIHGKNALNYAISAKFQRMIELLTPKVTAK